MTIWDFKIFYKFNRLISFIAEAFFLGFQAYKNTLSAENQSQNTKNEIPKNFFIKEREPSDINRKLFFDVCFYVLFGTELSRPFYSTVIVLIFWSTLGLSE